MTKAERVELNRRRNESLVQSRVPLATRTRLIREARRKRTSVSALVAAIIAAHFGLDVIES